MESYLTDKHSHCWGVCLCKVFYPQTFFKKQKSCRSAKKKKNTRIFLTFWLIILLYYKFNIKITKDHYYLRMFNIYYLSLKPNILTIYNVIFRLTILSKCSFGPWLHQLAIEHICFKYYM